MLGLLQRETDIVEAFHEAALEKRIDVESDHATIRASDLLVGKIDGDGGVRPARGIVKQLVDLALRQGDRQNAVLEAVVVEDVGEAWCDDAADAEVEQRPGRVLARRAAAEILAGDQDRGLVVGRLSANRPLPSPVRLIVFRYCFGMIMSVSTLIIGKGAAMPVSVVNFSINRLPSSSCPGEVPGIHELRHHF
jgi:hypothetical protein